MPRALASSILEYQWTVSARALVTRQRAAMRIGNRSMSEREPHSKLCLEWVAGGVVLIILSLRISQLSERRQRRGVRSIDERGAGQLHVGEIHQIKELRADRDFSLLVRQHEILLHPQAHILEPGVAKC